MCVCVCGAGGDKKIFSKFLLCSHDFFETQNFLKCQILHIQDILCLIEMFVAAKQQYRSLKQSFSTCFDKFE